MSIVVGVVSMASASGGLASTIKDAANRTVLMCNENEHPIQFEFCQKDDRRGEYMVQPGEALQLDFIPNLSTLWWVDAWFNGVDQALVPFKIWEGHGSSIRYIVRKDNKVFKAAIDGSDEHEHELD